MKRADLTEKLLDIKREKGWTWKHICEQIGGMSPVMITGALLGNHKLTKPQAQAAAKLFGLSKTEQTMLNEVPNRAEGVTMPPTDPLIYRFYELVLVNGPAWKELIQEEFGDGIMSAIDFDMTMERLPDPKGDRVKIGMSGKFLPFKYYGATGNAQAYGYKRNRALSVGAPSSPRHARACPGHPRLGCEGSLVRRVRASRATHLRVLRACG
jgi:cyanate lyase